MPLRIAPRHRCMAPRRPSMPMRALLAAGMVSLALGAGAEPSPPSNANAFRHAAFGAFHPSRDARSIAEWVAQSGDHGGAPFVIVDKPNARVLVFDGEGHLRGNSPVLLGLAKGDDSVPGIGERKIADIRPFERTTPAGRFVAEAGRNLQGEDIVWIDYDAAVSMHRVRATNPRERRLERLATPGIGDNRISYGCINVPAAFFDAYVSPLFRDGHQTIVYVLPDVKPLEQAFPAYRAPASIAADSSGTARGKGSIASARTAVTR